MSAAATSYPFKRTSVARDMGDLGASLSGMAATLHLWFLSQYSLVPRDLVAAASGLIESRHDAEEAFSWRTALCVNAKTLNDGRAMLDDITAAYEQRRLGAQVSRSIDRIRRLVMDDMVSAGRKGLDCAGLRVRFDQLQAEADQLAGDLTELRRQVENKVAEDELRRVKPAPGSGQV